MSNLFDPRFKQPLAAALGAEQRDYSTLVLARGGEQIRIESAGRLAGERRLEFTVVCPLERAGRQGAGAGYRQDPRPRLDGQPAIVVRWETDEDRKGKRWRINREVQTGDTEFDDRFYIQSDAPEEHIHAVLGSAETRQIVKTLFEHHCDSVALKRPNLEAPGSDRRSGELAVEYLTHALTDASFPQLVKELEWLIGETLLLRASLPLFVGEGKAVQKRRRVTWAYYALLIFIVLGIVSGIIATFPVDAYPIAILWGAGAGALLLFVPVAYLLALGHARGVSHFKGLLMLGFFTIPMGVFTMGLGTNWLLDTSEPQTHRTVVVGKTVCNRKNKHYADVQDWRDRRRSVTVRVGRRDCETTKPHDPLVVVVREGFWGFAWVDKAYRPR